MHFVDFFWLLQYHGIEFELFKHPPIFVFCHYSFALRLLVFL